MADALHDAGCNCGSACRRGRTSITSISTISRKRSIASSRCFSMKRPTPISPGPLASRQWFESWLHALLEDADPQQWIIALGSYGYDWTDGAHRAELISFPEAMSRASSRRASKKARSRRRITVSDFDYDRRRTRITRSGSSTSSVFSTSCTRCAMRGRRRFRHLSARDGRHRDLGCDQPPTADLA